jgi:hypothetical protein
MAKNPTQIADDITIPAPPDPAPAPAPTLPPDTMRASAAQLQADIAAVRAAGYRVSVPFNEALLGAIAVSDTAATLAVPT